MSTVQVILLLIILMTIGLFNLLIDQRKLIEKHNFASEYLSRFQQFKNSYRTDFNGETYYWLTSHVSKIQSNLGFFGIVLNYQPAFSNYIHKSYQIIVNTLPEMRNMRADSSMINASEDALIRYIGFLDDAYENSINQIKNPFKWLKTGVQSIISLPFFILYWLGLISSSFLEKIINNSILKLISGFIALIGFIASIMSIILGWETFVRLIQNLL